MPFKTFNNWLFDGDKNSGVPSELLKYNSPITHTYVLSLFMLNGSLNMYLDKYMNNIHLRYLDKEEFFMFIKKCVADYKIKRNSIPFIKRYHKHEKLFEVLRERHATLKNDDIQLLCEIINKQENNERIYASLGLDKPKKRKVKKAKSKKKVNEKITEKDFLKNFTYIEVE